MRRFIASAALLVLALGPTLHAQATGTARPARIVLAPPTKGAPEAIYRRSLWYYNLVNSPATMVNADDLENWSKGQWGLESNGGDWVSFHRDYGRDVEKDGVIYSQKGTSEAVMRSQFRAWSEYMRSDAPVDTTNGGAR